MSKLKYFLSKGYLLEIATGTKYEIAYLVISGLLVLGVITYRIFLRIKGNRAEAMRSFDKIWFWGYLTLGLSGLFIWFSRNQALPIFSVRLLSLLWIAAVIISTAFIAYYFKTKIPKVLDKYYETKRKAKYLKRG